MGFDLTHDCQRAFRALVDAHSYPGRVFDLSREAASITITSSLPSAMLVIILCLLDIETSFAIESSDSQRDQLLIAQLCGARPESKALADFIFVADHSLPLAATIAEARCGDLVDPHRGATIVAASQTLKEGSGLRLKGPGIRDENYLEAGRDPEWIAARRMKNQEFPLGVDLLFFDQESRIAALPRSTTIMEAL